MAETRRIGPPRSVGRYRHQKPKFRPTVCDANCGRPWGAPGVGVEGGGWGGTSPTNVSFSAAEFVIVTKHRFRFTPRGALSQTKTYWVPLAATGCALATPAASGTRDGFCLRPGLVKVTEIYRSGALGDQRQAGAPVRASQTKTYWVPLAATGCALATPAASGTQDGFCVRVCKTVLCVCLGMCACVCLCDSATFRWQVCLRMSVCLCLCTARG
jgi:hypothetical protein